MKRREALSTVNAARHLGCCSRHIRDLFHEGELEGFYKGAKTRRGLMIFVSSLEAYRDQEIFE